MAYLTIKLGQCAVTDSCVLCGRQVSQTGGPHLFLADSLDMVCRECGKAHAPSLTALLDLGRVAERVGNIGRHTLVPPLNALLDLARAAEDYTTAPPPRQRQAA